MMPMYAAETYSRSLLRKNPDKIFIFGDNYARIGGRGQAKACRGEPNAYGIPTKWHPSMTPSSFFYDNEYDMVIAILDHYFDTLEKFLQEGKNVVWPISGIGTGLARLEQTAPTIMDYIRNRRNRLFILSDELNGGYYKLE